MRREKNTRNKGYATLVMVCAVSMAILATMTFTYRGNLTSQSAQVNAQVKQDFSQKEDAILSALLHIVPNKAVGAMKRGSASKRDQYTWETIFDEAFALANAEQEVSPELLASLNLEGFTSANIGATSTASIEKLVYAPVKTADGTKKFVNGGNWWEYYMLSHNTFNNLVPDPLMISYENYLLDKDYPIISTEKEYVHWYSSGLHASSADYPLYNLIEYPDIKFGYRRPGDLFVAKRNWWTFSLEFGSDTEERSGIPPVKKNYVLSIYEVPSQLPLSSSVLMKVGKFADGLEWQNVSIDGGIYSDRIETEGTVELSEGSLSARKSMSLSDTTSVAGQSLDTEFDAMGKREERVLQSNSGSDFYDASVAGNVGKVAFIPLNVGDKFLKRRSDGSRSERISPTGWEEYTRGANQAAMRIEAHALIGVELGLPIAIRFHYTDVYGNKRYKDFIRGINWDLGIVDLPTSNIPFQNEILPNLRNALVLHLDRFPDFLNSLPYAAGVDVNNSIYIEPNFVLPILIPDLSLLNTELSVSLRGGEDLTAYSNGFSVVTDLRVYIGDNLNIVPGTAPVNAGFPADETYYPPFSVFSNEKRFGESILSDRPVAIRGQMGSLKTGTNDTFSPLDLKGADDQSINAEDLDAQLVTIKSPAELPPIHLMNWLVTIEEIH